MKCPHCKTGIHPSFTTHALGNVGGTDAAVFAVTVYTQECPECHNPIVILEKDEISRTTGALWQHQKWIVHPLKKVDRDPAPKEVPKEIAADCNEARVVLADSPKASAALSRRCLQHLLRERKVSTKKDLSDQIDDALKAGLPSHIAADLDAIRVVGNFAAHPLKSKSSGEILPVEPGEAEWNLDVLEDLFDFFYVAPAVAAAKREALNKKLADAGKPPLKTILHPATAAVQGDGNGEAKMNPAMRAGSE